MDKEWMKKDIFSNEYEAGVESFLQFALQHADDPDRISCPCAHCGNLRRKSVDAIRADLGRYGMDLTYHTWIWHGERSTSRNLAKENNVDGVGEEQYSEEEPIDMVHAAFDEDANLNQFSQLVEDAEKPLYPGCGKFTKLSAVVKLYNLKAKHGWSDKSFTELLSLFGEMLPDGNDLPLSAYDAKKTMYVLGMQKRRCVWRGLCNSCTSRGYQVCLRPEASYCQLHNRLHVASF